MNITSSKTYRVHIPFKITFSHSKASRSESDGILVCLEDENQVQGWGECAPRDYVTGETMEGAIQTIQKLLPTFTDRSYSSFEEVTKAIHDFLPNLKRDEHAAFCALELALLDLAGKYFEQSCADIVGPLIHESVKYSSVLSMEDVKAATMFSELTKKFGVRSLKVKVGESQHLDKQVLSVVRKILGYECGLRIDANCAWTAQEALDAINDYKTYNLEGIEQPLAADDIDGLVWLTERSPVPIIVDESLASFEDAQMLIERKACHAFNIRVSKCGGLCNSTKIRNYAYKNGIKCMMGAQVGETAILSAAGRHFATHSENLMFLEGSFGTLLLESDIADENLTFGPGGKGDSIQGYGLGITINNNKINRLADIV